MHKQWVERKSKNQLSRNLSHMIAYAKFFSDGFLSDVKFKTSVLIFSLYNALQEI